MTVVHAVNVSTTRRRVKLSCVGVGTLTHTHEMLQPVSTLQRQTNLRSATNSELFVPRTRLRVAERAFSLAAPRLWSMEYLQTSSEPPLY